MRGLSTGFRGNQSSATVGTFPNVAIYLDDQSMQFPARNVDIYMVDMQRVEVLEGPQGTLFGGGAEAGAVRYITNKPKLDTYEGSVEAQYGFTSGGGPNSSAQRHDQHPDDPGQAGRARGHLRRQPGRLHRPTSRAPSPARTQTSATTTSASAPTRTASAPTAWPSPARTAAPWRTRSRRRSTTRTSRGRTTTRSPTRAPASRRSTRSIRTGMS